MDRITETGQLSDEDEEYLSDAIKEFVDDFGPDFDAEGNPLEEGESDRIRSEEERQAPGRTSEPEAETEKEAAPA
jgi:F-type H+-transporting ATPase subunit alpha